MRIALLIASFVIGNLGLYSQSVLQTELDFYVDGLSINDALRKLSYESKVTIAFNPKCLPEEKQVYINVSQTSLENILNDVLKHTSIELKESGNQIFLYRKRKKYFSVSGYLSDMNTGEPLAFAQVYCPKLKIGVNSNEYGFYRLTLEEGSWDLIYNHVGFEAVELPVDMKTDLDQNISLKSNLDLPEVTIFPEYSAKHFLEEESDKSIEISSIFVDTSPGLGGEADFIRASQLVPGVQGGIDGMGGVYVRGGESDQNLMLLDGVPVHTPFHLLGLISTFNSGAVESMSLMKGNFSGRYGGRLSSVMDVKTREGDRNRIKGEAGANLVSVNALLEGPIKKGKGSFLFAGRMAHPGQLFNSRLQDLIIQFDEGDFTTDFYDFNSKVSYSFSPQSHLYVSSFFSQDRMIDLISQSGQGVKSISELGFEWSNFVNSIRFHHIFNDKLEVNAIASYSHYQFSHTLMDEYSDEDPDYEDFYSYFTSKSDQRNLGLKLDFDFTPTEKHKIRFGLDLNERKILLNKNLFGSSDDTTLLILNEIDTSAFFNLFPGGNTAQPKELNAYWEHDFQFNSRWFLRLGLRSTSFFSERGSFSNLEPRVFVNYTPDEVWAFHASINRMTQHMHLMRYSTMHLPSDLWLPASREMPPQKAWQYELGVRISPAPGLRLSMDAYYKQMENLHNYSDYYDWTPEQDADYKDYTKGTGEAYGLEFMLSFDAAQNGGFISYTLSKTQRQFDSKNLSNRYPFEQDARHQFKLFFYQQLGKKLNLSLSWLMFSPLPKVFNSASLYRDLIYSFDLDELGELNSQRSRTYQRLDLNANYVFSTGKIKHEVKLGVYNALNYKNLAFYTDSYDNEDGTMSEASIPSLPLLPTFSYSISF